MISWSSSNATSCTASGGWTGAVSTSGTYNTGALSASQTYNLACTGQGGTVTQSAAVTLSANPTTVVSTLPQISGVTVTGITPTSATVSWTTNSVTDGLVGWGPGASLSNIDGGVFDSKGSRTHSYTITGLYPSSFHAFFVRSRPVINGKFDPTKTNWAVYAADGCTGTCSFTTAAPPAGGFDYALEMTGPHNVVQGYDTYVALWPHTLVGKYKAFDLSATVTGLPPYTTLEWTERSQWGVSADHASGNSYSFYEFYLGYDIHLQTNVGGITPTGTYTLKVTGAGVGIPTHSATWQLIVNTPPAAVQHAKSYPPIPCLTANSKMLSGAACASNWTDTMNIYGQFWTPEDYTFNAAQVTANTPHCLYPAPLSAWPARCIRANDPATVVTASGGLTTQSWFYDGDLVFQHIGNYLGNPAKWYQGVANTNQSYRDKFVLPLNGHIQGYLLFTEGLYRDYMTRGDVSSKTAVDELVAFAAFSATPHAEFSITQTQREAAYRLEADLWGSKLDNPVRAGHPASYWLQYDVAHVIGQIEQQCTQNQPFEYFMTGLQAEALIKYYIETGSRDVRILPAVEQLAKCVALGWGGVVDDPYAFPYASAHATYGFTNHGGSNEVLNSLIAPMYAWLYMMTGDSAYLLIGDTVFQYGVTMPTSGGAKGTIGWVGNGGKQFSQSYRWSFDYVNWRLGNTNLAP